MYAEQVWNTVHVEGPQEEIVRMRRLCRLKRVQVPTNDPVVDFSRLMPKSSFGQSYGTYNLATFGPHDEGSFSFSFDCDGEAPVEIFEALAKEFPTLVFHVSCIGSLDEFMASGSYNDPQGSYFHCEEVPSDFWGT